MMVMVSAADLLTIYLGTELMSLSLDILAGLKRSDPLLARSFGQILRARRLFLGNTPVRDFPAVWHRRQHRLSAIAAATATHGATDPMLMLSMVLLTVGFGFKLVVVPFHMWTPDVYQGAPTSVTAYMAVASKAASFARSFCVFVEGLGGLSTDWYQFFLVLSIITMVLGNVVAIVQTNIKRMLAYSSIAHAGTHSSAWSSPGNWGSAAGSNGLASVMLYLAIYAFMTLGAFAIVGMLRKGTLEGDEIQDFTGLAKREPLAAFLMLVFLVSLAGSLQRQASSANSTFSWPRYTPT